MIGASSKEQLMDNMAVLDAPELTEEELAVIDNILKGVGNSNE